MIMPQHQTICDIIMAYHLNQYWITVDSHSIEIGTKIQNIFFWENVFENVIWSTLVQ